MWCHIEEPEAGQTVTDASGSRIWYNVQLRDASGSVQVGVPERIALSLSGSKDKDEFLQKHATGSLNMPLLCHVRISRSYKKVDSGNVFVNHIIEDAESVTYNVESAPNLSFMSLIGILNQCPPHNEGLLFAYLNDISADPVNDFKVTYGETEAPRCKYVVCLVASTQKSGTKNEGDGHLVTSDGVLDIANPHDVSKSDGILYSLESYCTINEVTNFSLNIPRNQPHKYALVLIHQRDADKANFQVSKIEFIEPDQIDMAKTCFQKLRRLCSKIMPSGDERPTGQKHDIPINSEEHPSKRCRTLQRACTGESIPE